MKIRSEWAEMLHAVELIDRQTDMTKLIVTFRNFANSSKSEQEVFNISRF